MRSSYPSRNFQNIELFCSSALRQVRSLRNERHVVLMVADRFDDDVDSVSTWLGSIAIPEESFRARARARDLGS